MKITVHDKWFHKKPKVKKIKICEGGCGNLSRNSLSKYCWECAWKSQDKYKEVVESRRYARRKELLLK